MTGIVSVQFGGALAATLLPTVGVAGSVSLRLVLAAAVLCVIARPRLRGHSRGDWLAVCGFAVSLGAMNLCFYGALERLPIGVTVTIEFVGPLVLAAVLSRTRRDVAAVALAALGVLLVSGALSTDLASLDLVGIGLALAAGAWWAAYIIGSRRTGRCFPGLDGLAIAMAIAGIFVLPAGVLEAGAHLFTATALLKGAGIAFLSSVLPYSLELMALRRLAANVFGILLSLEPVAAALAGYIVLGEHLAAVRLFGMALVVAASVIVLGSGRAQTAEPTVEEAG
ncbi:inner membrane transporter RhtA [Rudaeicoccus suwonensis]|uniref:Inner membrane transporter RhtA n=2 Tax=Rudaeicoccus suwonensis TaxID=657409 RepID=A0A561EAM5_9MICO|nr:EamA family transporter [Rudaeicoccus suwonensis]TWE12662.1 inner membrane transporter RhtA [Rudaeicoccus suwonensis]